MLNQIKGSFYALFFILLNLLYLVVELSFNARVLDLSASMDPHTDFGQLEVYGRTLSASGATLLAWRLLLPYHAKLNLFKVVIKFFVIAIVVFPLIFVGQKKLVDTMVDQSSNETRRSAEILTLLKYGIANGFVEIDELAMDELTLLTAEGKMFISVSGLLVYNSENMRAILERELKKIAGNAIASQQARDSYQLYKNYLYVRKKILNHYEEYQQLVNEAEESQSSAADEAIQLYESAINSSLLKWLDYQKMLNRNQNIDYVEESQTAEILYLLLVGQERVNSCEHSECYDDAIQMMQMRMSQNLGFVSPVSSWCDKLIDSSEQVKLDCIKDKSDINKQIVASGKLTLAEQAGLSRVYSNKLEYLKSMELRSSVFQQLKQQGIQVDSNWVFTEHQVMLESITQQIQERYLQQYNQAVKSKFEVEVPLRSPLPSFAKIPMMQNYFAQALADLYQEHVALDLDQQTFESLYVKPVYTDKYNALLNKLNADEQWYAADAPYERSGKVSLRNLLVPPIAIAFSLIFGLMNMINLLISFVFFIFEERILLRWIMFVTLSSMVIMLPTRNTYQIYDQSAYLELLSETKMNYGHWASALDWVAKTEPVVYPLGDVMRYHLLNDFSFD